MLSGQIESKDLDFIGSFNNQRYTSLDAERSINCFEYKDARGKKPKALFGTSGLLNQDYDFTPATGGFRRQFVFDQIKEFSVIGGSIFLRNTNLQLTNITNSLSQVIGYAGIDANTYQVLFVDGQHGYIYDTVAGTFTQITDSSFPPNAIDCCYIDGFFIVIQGGTNNFFMSSFNQGLIWGPASNFISASPSTNLITINGPSITGPSGNANFNTGVSFTIVLPTGDSFTGASSNSHLTLTSNANYVLGGPVRVTGGSLPTPLVANTTYYVVPVNASSTDIFLATSYANALSNTTITLTGNGSGTIISQPPDSLTTGTTYYSIVSPAHSTTSIKVASSLANSQTGTALTLASTVNLNVQILSSGQLQQGQITSHPGNVVACRTLHRRVFFFTPTYTEVWENAGIGSNLPLRRNNALLIEYGTPAIGSVSSSFDMLCFLAQSKDGLGPVMMIQGTQAIPISTNALNNVLSGYNNNQQLPDCTSFLVRDQDIIFYRMNFTLANHTFVYNVTQSDPSTDEGKMWHEEETLLGNRSLANTISYFLGNNYVGNYQSPTLYLLDPNTFTNDGEAIRRARITKAFFPPGQQRIKVHRIQIDQLQGNVADILSQLVNVNLLAESGQKILAEDGQPIILEQQAIVSNPAPLWMYLSISKDGGQTYAHKLQAQMGFLGDRTARTIWRKIGTSKRGQALVFLVEFFQDAPFAVFGASWTPEMLPQ